MSDQAHSIAFIQNTRTTRPRQEVVKLGISSRGGQPDEHAAAPQASPTAIYSKSLGTV